MGDMADLAFDEALDQALNGDEWHDPLPDSLILKIFFGIGRALIGGRTVRVDEWVTKDRKIIRIKKLETRHLMNILNMVARNNAERRVGYDRMARLRAEARSRGLTRMKDETWHDLSMF